MSMICGALKWLCDNEQREKERVEKILSGTSPVVTSSQIPESSGNANKSTAAGTSRSFDCFALQRVTPHRARLVYSLRRTESPEGSSL